MKGIKLRPKLQLELHVRTYLLEPRVILGLAYVRMYKKMSTIFQVKYDFFLELCFARIQLYPLTMLNYIPERIVKISVSLVILTSLWCFNNGVWQVMT